MGLFHQNLVVVIAGNRYLQCDSNVIVGVIQARGHSLTFGFLRFFLLFQKQPSEGEFSWVISKIESSVWQRYKRALFPVKNYKRAPPN